MSDPANPISDPKIEKMLDTYNVPPLRADFADSVLAAATARPAQTAPLDPAQPGRASRRPWMRRRVTVIAAAATLGIASMSAAATGLLSDFGIEIPVVTHFVTKHLHIKPHHWWHRPKAVAHQRPEQRQPAAETKPDRPSVSGQAASATAHDTAATSPSLSAAPVIAAPLAPANVAPDEPVRGPRSARARRMPLTAGPAAALVVAQQQRLERQARRARMIMQRRAARQQPMAGEQVEPQLDRQADRAARKAAREGHRAARLNEVKDPIALPTPHNAPANAPGQRVDITRKSVERLPGLPDNEKPPRLTPEERAARRQARQSERGEGPKPVDPLGSTPFRANADRSAVNTVPRPSPVTPEIQQARKAERQVMLRARQAERLQAQQARREQAMETRQRLQQANAQNRPRPHAQMHVMRPPRGARH